MNIFLDTSALFKLYHEEEYSDNLKSYINEANNEITALVISQLSKIEFASTAWKKSREKRDFKVYDVNVLLQSFENDIDNFRVTELDSYDFEYAKRILNRCNLNEYPLRSLDALQLATTLKLGAAVDAFITFDKKLINAATFLGVHIVDFYPTEESSII